MIPAPAALRLVSLARVRTTSRIPFGLSEWSDQAPALAVLLDLKAGAPLAAAYAQLPDPSTLAPDTLIVILGEGPAAPSLLGRLFRTPTTIGRAVRSTALLARGFVRIAAAVDPASGMDLVWAYAAATRLG